ncbi:MAG: hypothetical protein DCO96_05390 [Fluviicola sp. XM-24bin1]|nr:MAG: hypothetical protein DCO96_05390 [Fluviicola sp. XM-24bin1]
MAFKVKECEHLNNVTEVGVIEKAECSDCVEMGSNWVHLRKCVDCGYIGCCDSSVNKHATKHFQSKGHPVIVSAEEGENWAWCYNDEIFKRL